MLKRCTKCATEKSRDDFYRLSASPDGLAYQCKACAKAQNRGVYLRNTERAKEQALRWSAANPVRKAEIARAASARYAKRHPDRVVAAAKAWVAKNPEAVRRLYARKKAAKKSAATNWDREFDVLVEQEAWDLKRRRQRTTGFDWHIDHVVPLAGRDVCGLHNGHNLAVVPANYNMAKKNKFDEAVLSSRGWLC